MVTSNQAAENSMENVRGEAVTVQRQLRGHRSFKASVHC